MARNPQLHLDFGKLPPLDAIYLTHPHCDHFDPYSLINIYKHQNPAILLPETALYLKPLLSEYLGGPDIFILRHGEKARLFGLQFLAYLFTNPYHTNESDVMMFSVDNGKELLFYEGDTAMPESENPWNAVYARFNEKEYESRIYIATRNELEALFLSYDAPDPVHRKRRLAEYRRKRDEEMEWEYLRFDEGYAHYPEIWQLPGVLRILVGQGIIVDPEIEGRYLALSAPFPLPEVADRERRMARKYGRRISVEAHSPGNRFNISKGSVVERTAIPYLEKMVLHPVSFQNETDIPPVRDVRPLDKGMRNTDLQRNKILNLINNRFLPFQLGSLEDPLTDAMLQNQDHAYRIEVVYGVPGKEQTESYLYDFGKTGFELSTGPAKRAADERYWANDLEDFLDGKQDLFSSSLDHFPDAIQRRLWNFMGLPYLTSDIVYNKLRFHFDNAKKGVNVSQWVNEVITHASSEI